MVTPERNVAGSGGLGGRTITFPLQKKKKKEKIMLTGIMSVCCDIGFIYDGVVMLSEDDPGLATLIQLTWILNV